jgi:hypothetical protein
MIDGRRAHSGGDFLPLASTRLRFIKEPFRQDATIVRELWSVKFRGVNFISTGEWRFFWLLILLMEGLLSF